MVQEFKNVALVGAGGNTGPFILNALLEAKFNVSILSRPSSTTTFPAGVTVIKTDYSEESLVEVLKGQDVVVSAIAGHALGSQKTIIDAAIKAGVKRFIPSEYGNDVLDEKLVKVIPYFANKGDIIRYAQSKAAAHPEFTWTGVATGAYLDWGLKDGFLDFDLQNHSVTVWDDGNSRFSTTNLATVGRYVAAVLKHPEETANKYIFVHSFSTTQNEVIAALEKHSGKTWTKKHTTVAQGVKDAAVAFEKGDYKTGILLGLRSIIYGSEYSGGFEKKKTYLTPVLGLPLEDVDTTVKELLEGKRP
jgi:uncharacterized protein YbjT (DUF2867 family)